MTTAKFLNGPAAGKTLSLSRAPVLLRVVIGPGGRLDALAGLEDEPSDDERVLAYATHGEPGPDNAVTYILNPDQPTDNILRQTEAWRSWCHQQRPTK